MVSVIVPVYNVSKYLERCVERLSQQTYKDVEIILVDDGSTDDSGSICDRWASSDTRVRVIHKANGGLSSARNAGLDIAGGEYVAFVDSDDFVETDYILKLTECAESRNADVVICNYRFVDDGGAPIDNDNYTRYSRKDSFDSYEALKLFEDKQYRTFFDVVWNKLYKKDLWEGVRFPEGVGVVEDITVMPRIYHKAHSLCVIDDTLYNYVYRVGSLSHSNRDIQDDLALRIPMMEERLSLYREWNIKELCLSHIIHMYPMLNRSEKHGKAELKNLQKLYRTEYFKGNYYASPEFKRRIKYMLAAVSLKMYNKLAKAL